MTSSGVLILFALVGRYKGPAVLEGLMGAAFAAPFF
jgi:hypothetical protein